MSDKEPEHSFGEFEGKPYVAIPFAAGETMPKITNETELIEYLKKKGVISSD